MTTKDFIAFRVTDNKLHLFDDSKTAVLDRKEDSLPKFLQECVNQLSNNYRIIDSYDNSNFTYLLKGRTLSHEEIDHINKVQSFSEKIRVLKEKGIFLKYESLANKTFRANLQTIDYYFDNVLANILYKYYESNNSKENSIPNFIKKITEENPLNYDLSVNSSMYELAMRKFLTDYALGMRAGEVWKRNYQATGGYLIVRKDGELICYHFYFARNFEEYLFNNTKLDTPDPGKLKFGYIYEENGTQKINLCLQIRFIK